MNTTETLISPSVVEIQTINICNAKCRSCPWPETGPEKIESMTSELWQKILEELKLLNPRRVIPYLNNEPLLDKQLESRIQQVRSSLPDCEIEVSTNGAALTEKRIASLLASGVTHVYVSLFGVDEETNHYEMGTSFSKVWANLEKLADRAREIGGIEIQLTQLDIQEQSPERYKQISDRCKELGVSYEKWGVLNRAGNVRRFGGAQERDPLKQPRGCELNRHNERIYILHNGDVLFCCHDWRSEFVLGNVNEAGIGEIFRSEEYRRIRAKIEGNIESSTDFLCRRCKLCLTE